MFNRMRHWQAALLLVGAVVTMVGCTATPLGMATRLAGQAVNSADVSKKSDELMNASVAECDAALGPPMDIYRSTEPRREWRVYPVANDLLKKHRYVVEINDGRVIAVSKAERHGDVVVDTATYGYFKDKCLGRSPSDCQKNIGQGPPALSAQHVSTGELVQLYDARLVKDVQRPYYAVLRFGGAGGVCSQINIVGVAASSAKDPTAP